MVQYKLTYFPLRGAAETIRQIFAIAKQEFEDHRVPREEWPKYKPDAPFGQVPVLEEDGKKLAQSQTITRYVARKFGLAGKGAWEEAQVDSYADQWKDFMNEIRPYFMVKVGFAQGDLEKLKNDVFIPAIKKHFPFFVKAVKNSGSGYIVASGLTYVDLPVAEFINDLLAQEPKLLDDFPELKAHKEKVHSQPELKKWRETRPETPF